MFCKHRLSSLLSMKRLCGTTSFLHGSEPLCGTTPFLHSSFPGKSGSLHKNHIDYFTSFVSFNKDTGVVFKSQDVQFSRSFLPSGMVKRNDYRRVSHTVYPTETTIRIAKITRCSTRRYAKRKKRNGPKNLENRDPQFVGSND